MSKQLSGWKKLSSASWTARRNLQSALTEGESLVASGGDAISASKALSRELAAWEQELPSLLNRARDLLKRLETESNVQSDSLEQRLGRELTKNGHAVFGETALLVVDGIVHVQIDVEAGTVRINDVPSEDLEIKPIAVRVREETARLRRLITAPLDFLKALSDAYDREIRTAGAATGSQAHAAALALQIALQRQTAAFRSDPSSKHYREYPRSLFRADLYSLLASRETKIKGRTFHHAAGADTAGSVFMLVPALGRMAHVGRIWFDAGADSQ